MISFHGWPRVALLALALASAPGVLHAQQPPVRIMPLGDSLTYGEALTSVQGGYRNRLHTLLSPPNLQFDVDYLGTFKDSNNPTLPDRDHQGRPGFRADQVLAKIGEWLNLVEDPDVVLLLIGTNDIWGGQPVSSTLDELDDLIGEIATRRPFTRIIVSNLPPRYDGGRNGSNVLFETLQQQYNAGIPAIVAGHVALGHQVTMVDMHSVMTAFDYSTDGVHPSTGGYNKMADTWAPAVNAVIAPAGSSNPPVIARATGMESLTEVELVFSKPVAEDAVNLSNFQISGGITVSSATLDTATKRTITLTTSAQTPGLPYTITVSGVKDRTPQQHLIAPFSKASFLGRTVTHGGFENGTSGWTLTGNVERKSDVSETLYSASEGEFFVAFNSSQSTPNGVMSQTFATTVGRTYNLLFDLGVLAFNNSQQRLQVTVQGAGTLVSDIATISRSSTDPNVRWLPKSYVFVADSSSTTLVFTDVSTTSNSLDMLLDRVRLAPANTLAVTSSAGTGVNMTITPSDLEGAGNGGSGLIRSYNPGTSVTVTAPASHLGRDFIMWQRNGIDLPGSGVNITVTINGNQSINAIYEPNSAPVATNDSGSVNEGGNVVLNLAANDSDVDDGLDLTSIAIVSGPANGSLLNNGDGTVTYTHNGSETTSDSFTYTIEDLGSAVSNTATVNITVTPQNDAPVAVNDGGSVNEGGSVVLDLAANDSDADDGLDLTSIAIVSGPANGSLLNNGDGTVTYTHNGSETTSDSFTYTIEDLGSAVSNTATVSLTITPQNDAPVAVNDSGSVNEGGSVVLNLAGNDSDADDGLDLTSIAIVSGPANGSLLNNGDGTVTYTHNGSETTSDSFTYTIEDLGSAVSNTATVNITVTPQNDAPVADNPSLQTDEDTPLPIALSGSDVDGDTLVYQVSSSPAHGLLSGDAPNLTYTPDPDFHGADSFTFTVSDGIAPPVVGTISISVIEIGGTPFEEWAAIHGIDTDPTTDPDGDSVNNAIEYVLGGNPDDGSDGGLMPQGAVLMNHTGGGGPQEAGVERFCFSHRLARRVRNDPLTQVAVEWSADPAGPWVLADGTHGETTEVEEGAVVDVVRVFIPMLPGEGRLFARMRVTISPEP